jgi:predicted heme/steroid binding protein
MIFSKSYTIYIIILILFIIGGAIASFYKKYNSTLSSSTPKSTVNQTIKPAIKTSTPTPTSPKTSLNTPVPPIVPIHPDSSMRQVRKYTLNELSRYNGYDKDLPILTSFIGNVYDVSASSEFKPNGAYSFASGKDITFGFVNNCFHPDCLISDISNMANLNLNTNYQRWRNMFDTIYPKVGYIDPQELLVSYEILRTANQRLEQIQNPTTAPQTTPPIDALPPMKKF